MTMELDHDLGEGTSRSTNGVGNSYACPSLLEREARAIEWPGGAFVFPVASTSGTRKAEHANA